MAQFPDREAEIKVLAQNIVTGLTDNPAVYPAPPVTAVALQAVLDSLITLGDEAVGRAGRRRTGDRHQERRAR